MLAVCPATMIRELTARSLPSASRARHLATQFDGSRELAALLVGNADRCGLCLADDEHRLSMDNVGSQRQVSAPARLMRSGLR